MIDASFVNIFLQGKTKSRAMLILQIFHVKYLTLKTNGYYKVFLLITLVPNIYFNINILINRLREI